MGCGSSKPERPQAVYLRDLRQPYKYPQTQHPPARKPPMEYAPQGSRRQEGPRLPVNSRSQGDSRSQAESSHGTNPRSQAESNHRMNPRPQANPSSRAGRRPAANPWPQDNPIPNRFETAYAVPRSNRNAAHARRVEITIPRIADPLPEVAEVKARLSRYWDPMPEYGPPSTTDSEKAYRRTQRLSGPFDDMPDAMPASRTPSPPRPKRAKGKGRQLRWDTQHHQQWVGGRKEHGGQWSPDFLRIQVIEARLVDTGRDRRYQEEWNQGIRR